VWLIKAVVCVVAAALRFSTIGSCQSTATSCDCTARHRFVSSAIEDSDLYLYLSEHSVMTNAANEST